MTDRELMQTALRALKNAYSFIPMKMMERHLQAENALRDRLAQPEYEFECPRCGHCCQQREWVGLTDEESLGEIDDVLLFSMDDGNVSNESMIRYAKAIEAKLKEKNT
jgi:hypothetical protein